MEVHRALSDLAEVRNRLARLQRFHGYSGFAAAASGLGALIAGALQLQNAPAPQTPDTIRTYLLIWLTCLGAALILNYGAVIAWVLKHRGPRTESQLRFAALSIAPSIFLGGALSAALTYHGDYSLLPGTWYACYAIGLFASRETLPRSTIGVTLLFALIALLLLVSPLEISALDWWVMPIGFGLGQIAIGYLIWRDRPAALRWEE
jgi:hypothetical protein